MAVTCSLQARALPLLEHADRAGEGDGVYGRFAGDLDLGTGLGVQHTRGSLLGQVQLSGHYFSLSGIKLHYAESLSRDSTAARNFGALFELKPLFLPRWIQGYESGPGGLDLLIDSVALGLGPYWSTLRPAGDHQRGLQLSLALGLPLAARASGPWLELSAINRWPDQGSSELALTATLSWHIVHDSTLPR